MAVSVVELALAGTVQLQAWLEQTDSEDALTALEVTQIALGQAMGRFLQLIKDDTDATTKKLDANSDFLNKLRAMASKADANKNVTLSAADVSLINSKLPDIYGNDWKAAVAGSQNVEYLTALISGVSGKGEQISAQSSLNQSTLTTATTRYNQAFDLVTTLIKKFAEANAGTASNFRS